MAPQKICQVHRKKGKVSNNMWNSAEHHWQSGKCKLLQQGVPTGPVTQKFYSA